MIGRGTRYRVAVGLAPDLAPKRSGSGSFPLGCDRSWFVVYPLVSPIGVVTSQLVELAIDCIIDVGWYRKLFAFVITKDVASRDVGDGLPSVVALSVTTPTHTIEILTNGGGRVLGGTILPVSDDVFHDELVGFISFIVFDG